MKEIIRYSGVVWLSAVIVGGYRLPWSSAVVVYMVLL